MLNKTIDDEPVCVYILYILGILITKDKILPFSKYNVQMYNYYKNSRHI
jgi:hypothetical protein